jgi:hypothetical protein
MALFRYFIRVPNLPYEVRDQFNAIDIVEYLTPEKGTLKDGQPIVRVKTWWAVLDFVAIADGYIGKNLYDDPVMKGSQIAIGDPLSLVYSDIDDVVGLKSDCWCEVKVIEILRQKPKK